MSQTPLTQPAIPPPPEPDRSPPVPRRRRTGPIAIAIGVVVALVAGATVLALTQRSDGLAELREVARLEEGITGM